MKDWENRDIKKIDISINHQVFNVFKSNSKNLDQIIPQKLYSIVLSTHNK